MERAICEQCGERQPADWVAGDLCVACGAAVRREARCAWCAEWVPAVRFCRACGCEVVAPEHYGAARMLKSAGVDRFQLADRLRELDPEQRTNLGRIYNGQLAAVMRRVEEVRVLESCLLQRSFSKRLEEEWVPRLPMEKDELAALAAGPAGPFHPAPEAIAEIARRSPLEQTRTLACLALVRMGHFRGAYAAACQALNSDDAELALEAALAFAHWRVRLSPYDLWRTRDAYLLVSPAMGIDAPRLAEVAGAVPRGSPLRPWAAAALVLAWRREYGCLPGKGEEEPDAEGPPEWVRPELEAGLVARDPDLRFTCAMALGEDGIVARALAGADSQQAAVARRFLAKNKSPFVAPLLAEGPEETCGEILDGLWTPLPAALLEPVLSAVERCGPEIRAQGARLLLPSLTEPMVERLVRLSDPGILKLLLGAERLPAAPSVVRAALAAGLSDELRRAPQYVDFGDPAVLEFAARNEAAVEMLVVIADGQPDRNLAAARFLAGVAFGCGSAEVRSRAYRILDCNRDWLNPAGIRELFGTPAGFLNAVRENLGGDLLGKLDERWANLADLLAPEEAALGDFAEWLRQAARHDPEAAALLASVAVTCPAAALPRVASLLREPAATWACREVPARLLAGYDAFGARIEAPLAAELAGALAEMLDRIPAIELLARLARDHPELRKSIAEQAEATLKDRDWADRDLRPALDELAEAVGYKPEPEPAPEPPAPLPLAELDNVIVVADGPLKTLAEYVTFLKAMGAAANPMEVMARYGMTQDSFIECMNRWGEVIGSSDNIALRYAELLA